MYIKKVKLENFRNYDNLEIEFKKDFNLIYGDNAQGKTNILESIYLCAIGRSFQTNKDSELIKIGKDKAKIEVDYVRKDREGKINIEISDKKIFFINGIKQKKLSDIIGKINIVLFYPDNINIIIDNTYSEFDKENINDVFIGLSFNKRISFIISSDKLEAAF